MNLARSVTEDSHAKIRQIRELDAGLETTQAEVSRGYGVTVKLESLCRKLQIQTNSFVEERRQLTDMSQTMCRQTTSESTKQLGEPLSDP